MIQIIIGNSVYIFYTRATKSPSNVSIKLLRYFIISLFLLLHYCNHDLPHFKVVSTSISLEIEALFTWRGPFQIFSPFFFWFSRFYSSTCYDKYLRWILFRRNLSFFTTSVGVCHSKRVCLFVNEMQMREHKLFFLPRSRNSAIFPLCLISFHLDCTGVLPSTNRSHQKTTDVQCFIAAIFSYTYICLADFQSVSTTLRVVWLYCCHVVTPSEDTKSF